MAVPPSYLNWFGRWDRDCGVPFAPARAGTATRVPLLGLLALLALIFSLGLGPTARVVDASGFDDSERPSLLQDCRQVPEGSGAVILDCQPGFATPHDIVTIYPRVRGSQEGSILDFPDAVWVFDAGAKGRASLIIDFYHSGSEAIADLYDDQDGDGAVEYVTVDGSPRPVESRYPTITVISRDGWWVKDGKTSFNLDITVDGTVQASFGSGLGKTPYWEFSQHDGRPDFVIHVRDTNGNGKPDLEWRQYYPPFPESPALSGHIRTEIVKNPQDDEVPISGSIFWPYLGRGPHKSQLGSYVKGYKASTPPIEVDWNQGVILQVSEFVASRGNPGNFFIYSIDRVHEGTTNQANFENPFAFYDLAGRRDGWPDMTIRFIAMLPDEASAIPNVDPINVVEYTWDQKHDHNWSYSLNLVGSQQITQTIEFPDFTVNAVPPAELPDWVARQTWNAATFVEVMARPYWTSEHVYEYTPEIAASRLPYRYMLGADPQPPDDLFNEIAVGFRGEYTFNLDGPALLYVSPIDRRLHLRGATNGVWALGDGRELRYESLGGSYIDHWIRQDQGQTVEELWVLGDQAIYTSDNVVVLGSLKDLAPPTLVPPPRSHNDWLALGRLLQTQAAPFVPDDLRAMFEAAVSSETSVAGASVSDVRLTDDGFRFLLGLPAVPASLPWIASGIPGRYMAEYDAGAGYSAVRAAPAELQVAPVALIGGELQAGADAELVASVRNVGDLDSGRVTVEFVAQAHGSDQTQPIGSTTLDIPAGESREAHVVWNPPGGGEWQVRAQVDSAIEAPATQLAVRAAPNPGPRGIVGLRNQSDAWLIFTLPLLVAAAVLAGHIASSSTQRSRTGVTRNARSGDG